MEELSPRLLRVQLYGAAGTLAGMDDMGLAVTEALASELGLGFFPYPWHAMRDAVLELGSWLSLVCGSLGKFGQDLLLMAQSEVGEVREAVGGRSSAMPHKSNPVRCEALVTIARANAGALSGLHQAAIQEHERGGAGWQLEWQVWPDMAIRTAAAIEHAIKLADTLVIDTERMKQALEGRSGLLAQADIANPQAHLESARQIFDATLETLEDTDRSDHNLS
ncbi:MAG: lyase family protein [Geminicoccaceae bacterium]